MLHGHTETATQTDMPVTSNKGMIPAGFQDGDNHSFSPQMGSSTLTIYDRI